LVVGISDGERPPVGMTGLLWAVTGNLTEQNSDAIVSDKVMTDGQTGD